MYYVWLARGHEGMREPTVGATADGRRKGVILQLILGAFAGRAGAGSTERAAELRQARLSAHLQRRPADHGAGGQPVPGTRSGREGGLVYSRLRPLRLPADAAQHPERRHPAGRPAASRAAPQPGGPGLGLERLFLRTGRELPEPNHRPAHLRNVTGINNRASK